MSNTYDEPWDFRPDDDDEDSCEPIGSCDNCEQNIYEDDYYIFDGERLCDQCAWYAMGCPGPGDYEA